MAFFNFKKNRGTKPVAMANVTLYPNPNAQYFYQEKQTYNWPSVPAHETRAALTNAWQGNQLPGATNFIPGVAASRAMWNVPTSYMNTLKNVQFNRAYNIQGETPWQQSNLMKQAVANWQNRVAY